jgi:hypothetical protein
MHEERETHESEERSPQHASEHKWTFGCTADVPPAAVTLMQSSAVPIGAALAKVLDSRRSITYNKRVPPMLSGPDRKPKISPLTACLWLGVVVAFVALVAISVAKQV